MTIKRHIKKRGIEWMLLQTARLVNLGIVISASSKAFGYSGVLGGVRDSPGPMILSDDGAMLWLYSAFWAVCAIFAVIDFFKGRLGRGVFLYLTLCAWWITAYFMAWVDSGFGSWDWMVMAAYTCVFLVNAGYMGYIFSLRERIYEYQSILKTGSIAKTDKEEDDE